MAQEFNIVSFAKNHEIGRYYAEIYFGGRKDVYEIITNANIRYLDWINQFSILDGFDCPFNGDRPSFQVNGTNYESRRSEKQLLEAIMKFIDEECCEKDLKAKE